MTQDFLKSAKHADEEPTVNNMIDVVNLECDPAELVQADRVHTSLYTDAKLFDAEMEKISTAPGYGSLTRAKFLTLVATKAPISASSQ